MVTLEIKDAHQRVVFDGHLLGLSSFRSIDLRNNRTSDEDNRCNKAKSPTSRYSQPWSVPRKKSRKLAASNVTVKFGETFRVASLDACDGIALVLFLELLLGKGSYLPSASHGDA